MSVFRFEKNSAPTRDQAERYMIGEIEKKYFGPGGLIVLIEFPEATSGTTGNISGFFTPDPRTGRKPSKK